MPKRPRKVMILGLDAPISPRVYKYAKEGELPAIARVIDNGVWAKNTMVPLPTITPPNWLAIVTGAWPSTHGVTDFNVHNPGDALSATHGGFYSGDVKAEFVWNAIARAGKKSVVVNYPGTWPPVLKDGIQIGGGGVEVNQYFWPAVLFGGDANRLDAAAEDAGPTFRFAEHGDWAVPPARASLSFARIFCNQQLPGAIPVEFREPSGWTNAPPTKKALEATLVFRPTGARDRFSRFPEWQLLALDTGGRGLDRAIVCDGKDAARAMADLRVGQWSPVITKEFETEAGRKRGAFALKLLALSDDPAEFRLLHTAIGALDGWCYPEALAAEIKSKKGLPYPQPPFSGFDMGWHDVDTALEVAEFERQWLSDACTYILENKPWDFFVMHYHPPDHAWHSMSWLMDPATAKNEAEWTKYQQVELEVYRKCDRLAADVFGCADPDETVFALVSDHGAKATNRPLPGRPNELLERAGLLTRTADGTIDWSRTKAFAQRVVWVYVNLRGRDPQGIVEPGKEYREVQERIIRLFTDYVDPATGKKLFLFALRKEDARFINIYGDYVGDVVYAISEEFGPQHGPYLPTAEWGLGSLRGLFAMAGPGIKRGVELERNVWINDMVPTLCYLTGWPIPRDAEGAVIYQALENPDPQ